MTLAAISGRAAGHALAVSGAFHPGPGDELPEGTGTLLLLSPAEPGFWAHLTAQPEWRDGAPDPIDRWSRRVIGGMACALGGKAYFPFGGPPWRPFQSWALRSGRAWASPVQFLVHEEMGLFASYRGALALRERLELPALPAEAPCEHCPRPCLGACPAGALTAKGYDVPACHDFLSGPEGADCLDKGCAVRRACPVSAGHARLEVQSAYHMRLFHR